MSISSPNGNIPIDIVHLWMFVLLHCFKVSFAKVDVAPDEGALLLSKEAASASPKSLSICRAWRRGKNR